MDIDGKKTIRVFPGRTSYTPIDDFSFVGEPGLFIPNHDQIHVSVTFTWDLPTGYALQKHWAAITGSPVFIGGPALDDPGGEFVPGRYLKEGVTTTSRGCPNRCSFCFVPKREGKLRELEIKPGNIIQDNNLLACSEDHISKVFEMLRKQKSICFKGGLEPRRITRVIAEQLRGLRISEIWLACDKPSDVVALKRAAAILRDVGFSTNKLRCYVLIGFDYAEEEKRLKMVYESGVLPFAQLYRPSGGKKHEYNSDWKRLARNWSRPAIYKSIMDK